mgnify:CR=1 FL=1
MAHQGSLKAVLVGVAGVALLTLAGVGCGGDRAPTVEEAHARLVKAREERIKAGLEVFRAEVAYCRMVPSAMECNGGEHDARE